MKTSGNRADFCQKARFGVALFVPKIQGAAFLTLFVLAVCSIAGCAVLLPSAKQDVKSPWETFDDAKNAFDRVIPYSTNAEELKALGFDPFASPNIRVLTYLDIIQRFTLNPSFKKEDLDRELVDCLAEKKRCQAYEMTLRRIEQQRYGNFFLDLLRFKRSTRTSGWEFRAFIVLKNGLVVYKLWSGKPMVDEAEQKVNPLGILQDPTGMIPDLSTSTLF